MNSPVAMSTCMHTCAHLFVSVYKRSVTVCVNDSQSKCLHSQLMFLDRIEGDQNLMCLHFPPHRTAII